MIWGLLENSKGLSKISLGLFENFVSMGNWVYWNSFETILDLFENNFRPIWKKWAYFKNKIRPICLNKIGPIWK